jgi:hypothetical protein
MIGSTLQRELHRTAEMLVSIADGKGIYYAIALLYDSAYDPERIKALLPILQDKKGSIKEIDTKEINTIVDKYKKFINAVMEFEDENNDVIIAGSIKSIESISRVIENRLCDLVPEYKEELDNLDGGTIK